MIARIYQNIENTNNNLVSAHILYILNHFLG